VLTLPHIFYLVGALFVGTAILDARARRWSVAAFWAILAAPFLLGDAVLAASEAGARWPAQAMGAGVIALAVLATRNRTTTTADDPALQAARDASAVRLGNRLFIPALVIPVIVGVLVVDAMYLHTVTRWIDPAQPTLIALGVAATIALIGAVLLTRARPIDGLTEGRRLLDTIGWAVVLPIMLATLGTVFADSGVGKAVATIVSAVIPTESRLACMLAYGLGMVAFTTIMGNAFAAFPVMTAGVGIPLLVANHGADPAALGAIGMLTGYCGTLLTPMAANFNIVPAILLELRDPNGVIRAQVPTAVVLLAANLVLMYVIVFR
jgi:uncharacterized membrane protein